MKNILMGLILMAAAGSVWAACSYSSVIVCGRAVICVTCCDDQGQNCVTQCT